MSTKTTVNRKLTSRYFPCARLSRVYVNGKWTYTTDEDLSDCTANDIQYFLRTGVYWKR